MISMNLPTTLISTFGAAAILCLAPTANAQRLPGFDSTSFDFYHEFYGSRGYTDPQAAANLQRGMTNGLTFSPPVEMGMAQLAQSYGAGLILQLPGAPAPAATSAEGIEKQRLAFDALAAAHPSIAFHWGLMPEWDQSGGSWVPGGRPRYSGSKFDAYLKFTTYYQNKYPSLIDYLQQPYWLRNYSLAAVTDHSPNTYYAYEMGVELCLLERAIDELGDLSTGMAFVRGAARQYDRRWGIDLSSWRTSNNMATQFDDQGNLRGGWSASYLKRHYYLSFAGGAHVIQNEAAEYSYKDGRLNPFGQVTKDFADFALRRHPDIGRPAVNIAFMVDHFSGFDPKHWIYNQENAVWFQDIRYTDGDYMLNNLLRVAYPNHWLHGLTPGAPFADSAGKPDAARFQAFLAAGGDPRPYEPMPFTRWGDNIDIITNSASAEAMAHYKVIVLAGDVPIDARFAELLRAWVRNGGTVVANASQVGAGDEDLLGLKLLAASKTASRSKWLADGSSYSEPSYRYTAVSLDSAEAIATTESGDPLITRNQFGAGQVFFATPAFLQSTARDQFLAIGTRLLDSLNDRWALARINGKPIEYIVNTRAGKVIVTLSNNSASEWTGEITMAQAGDVLSVSEYTTDVNTPYTVAGGVVRVTARVPAYEVRMFAVEFSTPSQRRPAPGRRNAATADVDIPNFGAFLD